MGSLNDQLIHLSYGRPGLFRVMIDSTAKGTQGAVSVIKGHYPAPTMKAVVNPEDGQLYVTGFALWGHNSNTLSAFLRLRYTGKESPMPEKFQAREGGILLRFNTELDEAVATDISNYAVKRWNYLRSEKYGSGHYKLDGSVGEEHLPVLGAYLSEDNKALFLAIPNMGEVMQMELSYKIKSSKGMAAEDVLWLTVNDIIPPDLLAEGFKDLDPQAIVADFDPAFVAEMEIGEASPELGEQVFMKMGCIACHAVDGKNEGKIGPGMKGLHGSERHFKDGTSAIADVEYIKESIVAPGEKVVSGFEGEMPSFLGVISENDLESLVLYIKSL
jgi:cytochrome c2